MAAKDDVLTVEGGDLGAKFAVLVSELAELDGERGSDRAASTSGGTRTWRAWRLESLRRSLSMDRSGGPVGLTKDEAMKVIEQCQWVEARLRCLRDELAHLVAELDDPGPFP